MNITNIKAQWVTENLAGCLTDLGVGFEIRSWGGQSWPQPAFRRRLAAD